jgi:hypothetical protein
MSVPSKPVHPRKLYEQLRDLPTHAERARAALDFLCGWTGAAGGYLFLAQDGQPALAASSSAEPPSGPLVEQVRRAWEHELLNQTHDATTRTVDIRVHRKADAAAGTQLWQDANGVQYEHRMLDTQRGLQWQPVGMVLLQANTQLVALRQAHVEALCNVFLDAGAGASAGAHSDSHTR